MANELYNTPERRLDTILGDYEFWRKMQLARETDGWEHCHQIGTMMSWFLDTYGIQLMPAENDVMGGFSPNVTIVDEQKYMVFLLKYT